MEKTTYSAGCSYYLWNTLCAASILGIWPRFIEPRLLETTRLKIPFPLTGRPSFKILQVSDLHFHENFSCSFLKKVQSRIAAEAPDLIAITGDFLCHGKLHNLHLQKSFLKSLKAPFGVFAVLGNHDYSKGIYINSQGDYDVVKETPSPLKTAFKRLFIPTKPTKNVTSAALSLKPHPGLVTLLEETSVTLLNNRSVDIDGLFNLTGLGEHMAGQADAINAFANIKAKLPGVVLAHNPDTIPDLKKFPGNVILSGHTHGGEVNLPWIWKRFTVLENPSYKKGLYQEAGKSIYVSRGVGGTFPFRLNAIPEIVSIELIPHEI